MERENSAAHPVTYPSLPPPKGAPERIKIGGCHYRIRFFGKEEETGDDNSGYCLPAKCEIGICRFLHPRHMVEILMHEIQHALNDHFGVLGRAAIRDERISQNAGVGFVMLLADNPGLFRWAEELVMMESVPGEYPVA